MHGPTRIFLANLTPFSLQQREVYERVLAQLAQPRDLQCRVLCAAALVDPPGPEESTRRRSPIVRRLAELEAEPEPEPTTEHEHEHEPEPELHDTSPQSAKGSKSPKSPKAGGKKGKKGR